MANTYTLIASTAISSSVASYSFNSIPATYTDLKLVGSIRTDRAGNEDYINITFNGATTSQNAIMVVGAGSYSASYSTTNNWTFIADSPIFTVNTFTNFEVYIPNYASSNNKSFSVDSAAENNATTAYDVLSAGLWANSAAINSVKIQGVGNLVQYSTLYLYGIKNS